MPDAAGHRSAGFGYAVVHIVVFAVLTLLTQIGGVVWVLALMIRRRVRNGSRFVFVLIFLALYAAATLISQRSAPFFGRVPLSCFSGSNAPLRLGSPLFCILNRNSVTPELAKVATALAEHMNQRFSGTVTLALDANFPFIAGFPLLPHLSHDDGRKLDIAFYYRDQQGAFRNGQTRSPIGYFAFEKPLPGSPLPCATRLRWLTFRWDLDFLQPLFPDWRLEDRRMKEALTWLSDNATADGVEKIFVEPHVSRQLGISSDVICFQGCRAARHDDHIHIQMREQG